MPLGLHYHYIISWPYGIYRLTQLAIALIVIICISVTCPGCSPTGISFVYFATGSAILSALIYLIIFCAHVNESVTFIPWDLTEFAFSTLWAIFYAISMIITACASVNWLYSLSSGSYSAASVFLAIGTVIYAIFAFLFYQRWRNQVVTAIVARSTITSNSNNANTVTISESVVTTTRRPTVEWDVNY